MMMFKLAVLFSVLFGVIGTAASACTFPNSLQGEWESPTKGNITFTSNQMLGYDVYTYTNLTFECELRSGSKYVVKSNNFTILAGNEVFAVLCLKLTKRTTNKYTYFVLTSELPDTNNTRVVFVDSTTPSVTEAAACDDVTIQDTPQNTKILVRYGEALNEGIQCPDPILGQFWYYNGTSCNASLLDVCTDLTTLAFDYSLCDTQLGYSAGGQLICLYKVEDGSQVVTYVYNTDATVNSTVNSTYQYSCMVFDKSGGVVYVSQYPEECEVNQTATSVSSPGMLLELKANIPTNSTATEATPVSQAGLIAGLTVLFLIIIAAAGVGIAFLIWKKKKVAPANTRANQPQPKQIKEPMMLQEEDGRETITPSGMSAHIESRGGSHGKYLGKTNKTKIKAKPIISPRVIPRPPSHHALKRVRGKTTPTNGIILKKITLKTDSMNREETFYDSFKPIPSTEPPKVDKAPPEIQLDLPPDQNFSGLSRCSTTLSTAKITLDVSSARRKEDIKITSPRETVSRKTQRGQQSSRKSTAKVAVIERRKVHPAVRSRPVTREKGQLSVKTVKNAATYVKRANTLKRVKLNSKSFKKDVKLVGIIKKPKQNRPRTDQNDNNKKTKQAIILTASDAVKESTQEKMIGNKNKQTNEMPIVDVEDANFFMCSNEADKLTPITDSLEKDIVPSVSNDVTIETQNHRPQSPLVIKQMPAKHHKFVLPKFKNIQPPAFNFGAIVDKARKVSKMRTNKLRLKKESGPKTSVSESAEERTAMKSFSIDLKTRMKSSKQRRRPEMPALSRYVRMPTLLNWVEYSGLLQTPSMKMQQQLQHDTSTL